MLVFLLNMKFHKSKIALETYNYLNLYSDGCELEVRF